MTKTHTNIHELEKAVHEAQERLESALQQEREDHREPLPHGWRYITDTEPMDRNEFYEVSAGRPGRENPNGVAVVLARRCDCLWTPMFSTNEYVSPKYYRRVELPFE